MKGMLPRLKMTGSLVCLVLVGCGHSKGNPEAVKQQLASAIPPHCAPAQVLDYLNAQKIAHSPYHRDSTSGNAIEAEISVKSPRSIVNPTFDVMFRFDDQDRLKDYNVQFLGYIGM